MAANATDGEKLAATADTAANNGANSDRKVIVVLGATGQQGGSVVRALKDDQRFVIKAATRDPESKKAQELAKLGIEIVKLDADNMNDCKEALKGAYGVFLVTSYWDYVDGEREIHQGKNVVDAAKENNVQHLVFSGLKSAKEAIGKDGAHHLESKKVVFDHIVAQGVPYTVVDYAFYYENLLGFLKPEKRNNQEYVLNIPVGDCPFDMIGIQDSGEIVRQIFLRPDEFKGQWLALASERRSVEEYAAILTKILQGKKFVAGTTTPEQYAKLGNPMHEDLAVMYEFFGSGKYDHDVELTRKLNPELSTFEQWVEKNRKVFETEVL